MVAAKGADADRIVASPPKGASFYLVYGPDAGLVAERGGRLASALADPSDPFSLIRLEAAALAADPARLADEAYAVSMFGGRRVLHIRDAGSRPSLPGLIAPLLKNPPPETALVLEAGDLKPTHGLRAAFERDRSAYAIPCYADDAGAVGRLVDEEMKAHGLTITPDARSFLVSLLGGDRLITRGEVQKLCLYGLGRGRIEMEDVREMIGDSAGIALDDLIDAAATGNLEGLAVALTRARSEGIDAAQVALMSLRHFQRLDEARTAVDAGQSAGDAVAAMRPPVFFKRKAAVEQALQRWTAPRLARALQILGDAVRTSRLNPALAEAIVGETLVTLARAVNAQRQGRR